MHFDFVAERMDHHQIVWLMQQKVHQRKITRKADCCLGNDIVLISSALSSGAKVITVKFLQERANRYCTLYSTFMCVLLESMFVGNLLYSLVQQWWIHYIHCTSSIGRQLVWWKKCNFVWIHHCLSQMSVLFSSGASKGIVHRGQPKIRQNQWTVIGRTGRLCLRKIHCAQIVKLTVV